MITKNYIKMCEKAKEIQCDRILGRYDFGDLYYLESKHKHGGKFRFIGSYDGYDSDKELIEKSIWLPTQEQLQEMMIPILGEDFIGCAPLILNKKLYESLSERGIYNWGISYNELWLAFVMKEKYHKVWDGEKWQ